MALFYLNREGISIPSGCFLLEEDGWNDWWEYKTLFVLYYKSTDGILERIGSVKIGNIDMHYNRNKAALKTTLPPTFDTLDPSFFSVGQSREYYENLQKKSQFLQFNPFESLNDIAYDLNRFNKVKNEHIVRRSLLRDVSPNILKKQFHRISIGGAILTEYDFSYKFLKNIKSEEKVYNVMNFHVNPNSNIATNIHVIIGRNGSGKTRLLQNMIKSYFDNSLDEYFVDNNYCQIEGTNDDEYKIFPNVIYSSYSAFDDIKEIEGKNFSYLGLRKKEEVNGEEKFLTKSVNELTEEFVESFMNCMTYEKAPRLSKALSNLEFDLIFAESELLSLLSFEKLQSDIYNENGTKEKLTKCFENFSTGHRVILMIITKLVELLEEQTLVLLDEPETHLHPPLLSAFIRCLSELLLDRNAVAIIATHSSIVLQEVPQNCVWKIRRNGYESCIERPTMQTFGSSHSELNEEVFRIDIEKTGFHQLIKKAVDKFENYDELVDYFDGQLGSEAEILAKTLFYLKSNEHES